MNLPPAPRSGSCLCGAIRYTVSAPPLVARICWCRTCQKISANGTANALFPAASLEVSGTPACFASTADSGNVISRYFCASCGCHLFAGSSANANVRVVRLGTLDDPSAIAPQVNIWTASAPSWACLDPALPAATGQPTPPPAPDPGR